MTNNNNQSKFNIYQPLIYILLIILGIYIGFFLLPNNIGVRKGTKKINEILTIIKDNYVDTINENQMIESSIYGVLSILDPHSIYITTEELKETNESLEGNFEGIGVQFNIQNDTIVVVKTISGGPSEKKGIMAGDRIVKIDNKNVAGIKITNQDVMKSLKGEKGSEVNIGIKRKNISNLIYFTIIRDVIPTYSIDIAYMANKTTGYIKINQFSSTTNEEFDKSIEELLNQNMKNLIIDLRGNAGGYLNSAVYIVDEILDKDKLIVYTEGRKSKKEKYFSTDEGKLTQTKIAILIDEWSASASEIVAGAIQDNDRGTIIGRRSFGKGLVQNQIPLSDGSAIRLTIARYYTPTGRCIQRDYQGTLEEYYEDFLLRYEHGEFENPDSIKFIDSLKFQTPNGKIVYGGGGIMPDIFIPIEKKGNDIAENTIFNNGLINKFAFIYADNNRNYFKQYNDAKSYIKKFVITENIYLEFKYFVQKEDKTIDIRSLDISKHKIKTWLKAFIGRNIFNDDAFYPILLETDNAFKKALEIF